MSASATTERDRVIQLLADYCRFVDHRDAASWVDLFAEGGVMVVRDRHVSGSDELKAFAESSPTGVHITGLPAVEAAEDPSTLRVTSSWSFSRADGRAVSAGYYHDTVIDDGSAARFLVRQVEMIGSLSLDS